MYEPETILALKEPRSTEDDPFPYDRVKVVGASPINHGISAGEWSGASGQGVIVTPLEGFGSTLDEPLGKLQQIYNVEEVPSHEAPASPIRVVNTATADAGKTPEEVFAEEAPGKASKDGERVRTTRSPLDDVVPDKEPASPLDKE